MAATKKIVVPKKTAVAAGPNHTQMITVTSEAMDLVLQQTANVLSRELKPPELCTVFSSIKDWEKNLTALAKNGRDRLLDLVLENGEQVTETGTKKLDVDGGWEVEARPRKTGVDGKKLEALLRAKKLDVGKYMIATITYAPNELGVEQLIKEGKVTPEEMATCHHELEYNLMTPKKVSDE